MSTKPKQHTLQVPVTAEQRDWILRLARERDIPVAQVVREATFGFLKRKQESAAAVAA